MGHFRVILCLCFKTSLGVQPLYGNEIFLHVHCLANQTHFRMKDCAQELENGLLGRANTRHDFP